MKIGLIGFGFMGKTHAWCVDNLKYFYRDLPFSAEIAAVCASRPETTAAAAEFLGVTGASEDEIINDPEIDVIDICTPNIYHYETLKKAIAAGKHIYCEKPLCVTEEQAADIARLAEEKGITAQIVFNNRFLPAVMKAKELIFSGRLGKIISFRCEYLHASATDPEKNAGWKQDRDICGAGTLFDLGSHAVDMMQYLCGEIISVKASSQIAYPERRGRNGEIWRTNADEAFYMICKTDGGAVGTVDVSKLTVGANDELNFAVYGEKGSLKFSMMDLNWLYFYDAEAAGGSFGGDRGYTRIECCGRYEAPGGIFPSFKAPIGWLRGHLHSMYSFLSAVNEGREATPNFKEAASVQRVLALALEDDEKTRS
ncbi:MAG: Gfo/Idh/MocA family oxidoreductase [Ruminococcaceae bacterium]|nr:Gfo/Idh/MocA family oxidoreductase [Oscillospiraceae bacterium]